MSLSPKPTKAPTTPKPTGIGSLAGLLRKRNIIADLYNECTRFYSMILKRVSLDRDIPQHIYRGLEGSHSSLILWAQGYGVADGNLDDLLKKSRLLQSMTLEPLIRISETLRNRLHPQFASRMHKNDSYPKYTLFVLISEAKQMLRVAQNGLRDLEGGDFASCLDTIDLLDEDSIEDMVADIKTDTQCLIDLDSMYEYPVNDLESHPGNQCEATSAAQNWREGFVDCVYRRFSLADQNLIQQLGWFFNGRLDMRKSEYNSTNEIPPQTPMKKVICDTLISYFKTWALHKDLDSTCPLCRENVHDIHEFFKLHLPEHADELYYVSRHAGLDRTNFNDSGAFETKPAKLLSGDLAQTNKGNKASAYTKQDLNLQDRTHEESEDEHGPIKTSPSDWKIMKTSDIAKLSTNPKSQPRMFCNRCNDHPGGFRGKHELSRHIERAHSAARIVWVCVDISPDKSFLANCKACRDGKRYSSIYDAAAHLRRAHFNPRKRDRDGRGEASYDNRRGGKGGDDQPPMDVLKQWMEEREEVRNADTDTDTDAGQSSEDGAP